MNNTTTNNHIDYSYSYSQETIVPGHLFLWNTFEDRNNSLHSSDLTLIKNDLFSFSSA